MEFEKGVTYAYDAIAAAVNRLANEGGPILGINSHGPKFCGQHFLVIGAAQKTFSFVLTGTRRGVFLYECIFAS